MSSGDSLASGSNSSMEDLATAAVELESLPAPAQDSEFMEAHGAPPPGKLTTADDQHPGTSSGIDLLLQRHRNDIMFELRRLQMGDRPVTGQGNKEAVENFFVRNLTGAPQEPSEDRRPESVTVEVNALVQRRPVSSILQSAGFRRNLETALRGALSSLASRPQTRPRPMNSNRYPPPPPPPLLPSDLNTSAVHETASRPLADQLIPSELRQNRTLRSPARDQFTPSGTRHNSPILPAVDVQPAPNAVQPWLLNYVPVNPLAERHLTAAEILEQNQREEFISDISELVQRQLVTSSLDSHFRDNLENLMMRRLDSIGTDGRRVQQFIQSLPPRPVPRNDFSDLGINAHAFSDNMDAVSVISATAAVTVPYAQSTAALTREMAAMKAQLTQLRNMMQMSLDMNLDIQRAIRQEVAAAVSQATPGVSTAAPPVSRPVSEHHCLICLDNAVDSVLYQCGHMCVCYGCGMDLKRRNTHCPVCRAPIRDIIRAYRSNAD